MMMEDGDIGPPILYPQEELAVQRDEVPMAINGGGEGEMSTDGTMEESPSSNRSLDEKPELEMATAEIPCDSSPKLEKTIDVEDTII